MFRIVAETTSSKPFSLSAIPLGDPAVFADELRAAGFVDVWIEPSIYATSWPSTDAFWDSMQRTLTPLVLLRAYLPPAQWPAVADRLRADLGRALGEGEQHVTMPAWLGSGRKP